ncbi:hypothetical protein C8J55DRAFT_494513 [Lentinula edodes]|uniref:Uncharacterized protein n=1 Tax=Lentinula lateritia TaxID=40482 RepID=A0A9W8ZP44_9AGAR|nr:hypothetical protein C8J55DRAFT_494513 [Lentinula edodes]
MLRVTVVVAIIFAVLLGVFSSPITLSPPYDLKTQVPSWPYREKIEDSRSRLALMRWTWKTDMPEWDSNSLRIYGTFAGSSIRRFSGSVSQAENWAICIDMECFVATMNDNWTGVEHFQTFQLPKRKTRGYIQITGLQATVHWVSDSKREQCWRAFVDAASSKSKDILEFYNHMMHIMLNDNMLYGADGSILKEVPSIWTEHYNAMQNAWTIATLQSSQ